MDFSPQERDCERCGAGQGTDVRSDSSESAIGERRLSAKGRSLANREDEELGPAEGRDARRFSGTNVVSDGEAGKLLRAAIAKLASKGFIFVDIGSRCGKTCCFFLVLGLKEGFEAVGPRKPGSQQSEEGAGEMGGVD